MACSQVVRSIAVYKAECLAVKLVSSGRAAMMFDPCQMDPVSAVDLFTFSSSHWTKTKCKWFAVEPGGGGAECERLVFDPPPADNDEWQDPA